MKFYVYRKNKNAPGTHGWLGAFMDEAKAKKAIAADIAIQKSIYDIECARLQKMGRSSSSVPPIHAGEYEIVPARDGITRADLAVERADSKVHFWYPKAIKDLLGMTEPEIHKPTVTHCFAEDVGDEDGFEHQEQEPSALSDFFPPMTKVGKSLMDRQMAEMKKNGF